MDSWLRYWSLAALLCPLILLIRAEPKNGTGMENIDLEVDPTTSSYNQPTASFPKGNMLDAKVDVESKSGGEDFVGETSSWSLTKAENSQESLSTESEVFAGSTTSNQVAGGLPSTDGTYQLHPSGITIGNNESSSCEGCRGEDINRKPPVRSLLAENHGEDEEPVTGMVWPFSREALDLEIRKRLLKSGIVSATESQEDAGSGDHHVQEQGRQVTHQSSLGKDWDLDEFIDRATASPSQTTITFSKGLVNPSTNKAISPDSAEIDHLLQVSREAVLKSPSSSDTDQHGQSSRKEKDQGTYTVSEKASDPLTAQGAQGSKDITMVTDKTESPPPASVPPVSQDKASEAPPDHSVDDLINFDYYDLFNIDGHGGLGRFPGSSVPSGDSTKKNHDKKVPWPMPELYDDFTPFDESDFYPTTSFYADGDDEGGVEDDDDDDDIEDTDDIDEEDTGARDVGHVPKAATLTPKLQTIMVDEKPTSRQHTPHQTFILYGGDLHPKLHPDINKDLSQTALNDSSTECRNGYVRRNYSCKSVCEMYPTYCYNGGQCYIVENTGAFCRCNTQDYIWHKGIRCESIVTDFQVMCVAVGTAALVVLLLFMMTVFFAKKLYLLKTENYKLRKRKYRTPSELHNDNFSLSTIAEGSHPNEDPNAPQKVQDLPKACLKDEEPFNIQNSLSPKLDSGKGDVDIADVKCVLNNLT
ncbi:chondroitin sulfate proteoglycan 5 isoform X4 [Xenopus laevis]|uniref:Chondroitin sulfate proteoglycan 5 isoform X4 n=1 Tax=Xenopus laevis TaxID=8355 RepID=A0A8J1L3S7_XENLA|nr:chondroitin sulfate proteoglycan 5 isoform X4 [Xenopus laevis]